MYNVTQAARRANVSGTTIRNWTRDYEDYLSLSANPAPGQVREFTDEDLQVFTTIAVLRSQLVSKEDITAALDQGQRLEPLDPTPKDDQAAASDEEANEDHATADIRATAEKAMTLYDGQVRDLQAKNSDLTERLMEARERAAAAEKELSILRELYEAAVSTDRDPDKPMGFWEWVQSRRR